MKKKYMEPQMVVEDFTVSEMVAADCAIPEAELLVVTQIGLEGGCDSGHEGKYYKDGKDHFHDYPGWEAQNGMGTAYAFLSDLFDSNEHDHDLNGDGHSQSGDSAFNEQHAGPGVCEFDPIKAGTTFGFGYVCSDDTSAIQKS